MIEYNDITVAKLKKILEEHKVDIGESNSKSELYDLYKAHVIDKDNEDTKANTEQKETETPKSATVKDSKPRTASRVIAPNELIEVRSITQNGLTYVSPKTGLKVTWGEYGDVEYLEFAELMTMRSMARKFLDKPYVVIDDEDVAQKLGLAKVYDSLLEKEEVDAFLAMPVEEIEKQLDDLPSKSKELIAETVRQEVGKTFNDIRKISLLEKKLNIGLTYALD